MAPRPFQRNGSVNCPARGWALHQLGCPEPPSQPTGTATIRWGGETDRPGATLTLTPLHALSLLVARQKEARQRFECPASYAHVRSDVPTPAPSLADISMRLQGEGGAKQDVAFL